jgi:hypothetical protein
MDQSEYGGLSNLGGARQPTFANQLNAQSVIPTIDTGKTRRMAGGSRTAQSNADAIPTLGNRSKSGASGFNDDVVSNQRGRSGY